MVPKAPDPRQRSNQGQFGFVAADGHLPSNEISLLNGKVFLTKEAVQEIGNNEAKPNVWKLSEK